MTESKTSDVLPPASTVRYPEGNVLLRNLSKEFPVVTHGEGMYLFDAKGKKYIDGSGGAMVAGAGHGNREIAQKIFDQISKVAYVNGTQFTNRPAEELAAKLARLSPDPGLNRAFFLNSGSEAIEAAIKFVRQLWVERKQPGRAKLIARVPSYHGNTLYALSASARPHYKTYYGPLLHDVVTVPAPYEYRSQVADYAKDGAEHYASELEKAILREGPETVGAFIFEPVIGSSAGATLPPPGYFERVQEICRRHGVLMIADEVLCGSGRTGKFFAGEHFGLKPDLIVLGKGISGGYAALSAVLVRDEHVREMKAGTGYFMHAQTYLQAPFMTVAGVATLEYLENHRVLENAARTGEFFHRYLHERLDAHPHVGFVTGKGMLAGVEFVADKTSKKPFDRKLKKVEGFVETAFRNGLVVWPNVGQADGVNGDLVMLAPPLATPEAQIRELVDLLTQTVGEYFG